MGVFRETNRSGAMHESMRLGEITLLHKKDGTREIRNDRPNTLLNADYKILTKIAVRRIKRVTEKFVHESKCGFVPGRNIGEAIHLCKLVQAHLDKEDEDALMI